MLDRALQWAYARWGARYPKIALAIQFQASHFVVLAGVALLTGCFCGHGEIVANASLDR